jgi:phage terminase large subunit-like protein
MQRTAQILRETWIDCEELPQTESNLTTATETLYDFLINRRLKIYPNEDLRSQILNASTKETERVFRLKKEKQSRKIDAAVALSFAILAAVRHAGQRRGRIWGVGKALCEYNPYERMEQTYRG